MDAMVSSKIITLVLACTVINIMSLFANVYLKQKSDLYLIVGLSFQHTDSELAASWERGREILPGAQFAVESINRSPDIFPGHTLRTIEVNIGRCDQQTHNFLLQFINFTFHQEFDIIGAVGIFCPTEVQIIAPLSDISRTSVKRESLKAAVKAAYNAIQSVSAIKLQALLEFLEVLDWRTIAVITDTNNTFFSTYVEYLYKASASIGSNVTVDVYNYAPNIIHLDLPRIVLVSVGRPLAVIELLCNAYKLDLMWPKQVWMLHTYHLEEFANINVNTSCNVEIALENVLIINEKTGAPNQFTDWLNSHKNYISKLSTYKNEPNVYSMILHDLVWSVALAVNDTLPEQFAAGMSSSGMSPLRQIRIIQVRNFTEIPIAVYSNGLTFSDPMFITNAPSGKLIRLFEGASLVYTILFTIEIIGGFVFVTVMLFGYSFFRQEPEIKSTSFTLSLLVFLGCYLLFVYLSILLYFHQPWATSDHTLDFLCISLNWFSGLGVSSAMIMVTLLVKIFRINHIFHRPSVSALSKRCSDTYLAIYVTLILLPMLLIHILWTVVDPYLGDLKTSAELNVIRYQKQCKSNYSLLWYALLTVYMTIIFLILMVVAFKMRKIKNSNFKDTKKVTVLVVCYFLDILITLTSWRILYTAVNAYLAAIVLHMGHFTLIMLIQILLFAPKVLPPFVRYIKK